MNDFPYQLSKRKRIKNFFLLFFQIPFLERGLIWLFQINPLFNKIIPPEYLYKPGSFRNVIRGNVKYRLDISQVIDHALYFHDRYFTPIQLFELIKSDSIIVDVGANIGTVAIRAASICTNGFVYAFEPNAIHYQRLLYNNSLNNFTNLEFFRKGLGEKIERMKLYQVNRFNTGMNRLLPSADSEIPFEEVEISTLDFEMEKRVPHKIDLIKIDVEGFEYFVLMGAFKTIVKYKPMIVVEVIDANLKAHRVHSSNILNLLSPLEYKMLDLKTQKPLEDFLNIETDILFYHSLNPLIRSDERL